jgi:glutathione S-transferase
VPSAIERYQKEMLRVFGVLESILSKQSWLVGDKMTIADISFITYVSGSSNSRMIRLIGSPHAQLERIRRWQVHER